MATYSRQPSLVIHRRDSLILIEGQSGMLLLITLAMLLSPPSADGARIYGSADQQVGLTRKESHSQLAPRDFVPKRQD